MFTFAFFWHFELALILTGICIIPYIKAEQKEITKKKNEKIYKIAFCDDCDIATKFGEEPINYTSYESAKNAIFSKVAGWGYAIQEINGDSAKIDGGWLIIFEKDA